MREEQTTTTYQLEAKELLEAIKLSRELFVVRLELITTPDDKQNIILTTTNVKPKNVGGNVGYSARS